MTDPVSREDIASQPERTALAWSRTLIGLAGVVGFLAVHAALGGTSLPVSVTLFMLAAATLISSSKVSRRTWVIANAAMDGTRPASRPLSLALLSIATVVVASVSMTLVFLGWR
jgi:uncharacterized membrane protein YidH (DUF202 family)